MTSLQFHDLELDPEQQGDEVIEVRCDLQEQRGGRSLRRWSSTRFAQLLCQRRAKLLQMIQKAMIEPRQTVALIKVLKTQAKRQGERRVRQC